MAKQRETGEKRNNGVSSKAKAKMKWRHHGASGVAAKMSKSMAKKWRRRQRHQPAKWHRKRINENYQISRKLTLAISGR
jgi:hypothetical protein